MYWYYAFWESEYDASPLALDVAQDSIVFDGYSLNNLTSIITTKIDYDNQGRIDLNSFDFPKSDGGAVISKYYRGRTINIEVTIKASTAALFNTLIDNLKKEIRGTEGYLDITVNSEIRRIKATLTRDDFGREHYNVTFASKVKLTFTALEPFFYAKAKQSYEFLSNTGTFSGEITNAGSADSLPVFYFICTTGAGMSSTAITAFGRTITVSTPLVAGDILIIDSENKDVTKNGVAVDYTGYFPVFPAWSNPFTCTFVGTTNVDLTIVQNKNYL